MALRSTRGVIRCSCSRPQRCVDSGDATPTDGRQEDARRHMTPSVPRSGSVSAGTRRVIGWWAFSAFEHDKSRKVRFNLCLLFA